MIHLLTLFVAIWIELLNLQGYLKIRCQIVIWFKSRRPKTRYNDHLESLMGRKLAQEMSRKRGGGAKRRGVIKSGKNFETWTPECFWEMLIISLLNLQVSNSHHCVEKWVIMIFKNPHVLEIPRDWIEKHKKWFCTRGVRKNWPQEHWNYEWINNI